MGIKNLHSYLCQNITFEENKWEIDEIKYNKIRNNSYDYKQEEKNGDLVLVIDAITPFYEIGEKISYLPFDYKIFIKEVKKVLFIYIYI